MKQKTIKISEKNQKALEHFILEEETARIAFREASQMIAKTKRALWDAIMELYPKVDSESRASLNYQTYEIRYSSTERGDCDSKY